MGRFVNKKTRAAWVPLCALGLVLVCIRPGSADLWTYKRGDEWVITDQKPKGEHAKRATVLYKQGPGKAQIVSSESGVAGCKTSRADVVPAVDTSPERVHRYDAWIQEASRVYAIPEALIRAVMKTESDYDPRVVSCAGARGLMQLMPDVQTEQRVDDVFDPQQNIFGGVRLLRVLANRFQGDLIRTVAGYHAGPGAVLKYGGIPPYETTQRYVRIVVERYEKYKRTPP